jgi:hypothetical protein
VIIFSYDLYAPLSRIFQHILYASMYISMGLCFEVFITISDLIHSYKHIRFLCRGRNNSYFAFGCAIFRRVPTATAQVEYQARSRGICGGQSGSGAGILRVLRIPLPVLIPPSVAHSLIILSPTLYTLSTESVVIYPA